MSTFDLPEGADPRHTFLTARDIMAETDQRTGQQCQEANRMANRLAGSTSPYLLQHKDNPVDWWPWCAEAFEEARQLNRPVLLSVGYAACHWCQVIVKRREAAAA